MVINISPSASSPRFGGIYRGGESVPALGSLKTRIEENLRMGSEIQASYLAFDGISRDNIVSRFDELVTLSPQDLGKILNLRPRAERIEILRELGNSIDIENRNIGEAVSLVLLDRQDLFNDLTTTRGAVRKAAKRFLFFGSMVYPDRYMAVYDQLQRESPSMYENDWYDFLASDGQTMPGTIPIRLREGYLNKEAETLKDTNALESRRITAANILGRLGAVEHFDLLFSIAKKGARRRGNAPFDNAIAKSLSDIFGRLKRDDNAQRAQRHNLLHTLFKNKGILLNWVRNNLINSGIALDVNTLPLIEELTCEGKIEQDLAVRIVGLINNSKGIFLLMWILFNGEQSSEEAFYTVQIMDKIDPTRASSLIHDYIRANSGRALVHFPKAVEAYNRYFMRG